jgi:hypothetical protein
MAQNRPFKLAQVAYFGEDRRDNGRHEEIIQSILIHDSQYREYYGAWCHDEVLGATTQGLLRHQPVQRFKTGKKTSSPCFAFCKKDKTTSGQKTTRNLCNRFNRTLKVMQETLSQIWNFGSRRSCGSAH